MANLNLSQFTEKTFVADADWTFVWDTAGLISKKVSRNNWLNSGELLTSAPVTISQTWSTTGTYTAASVNVTETATAASASRLLDLQVGGTSKFNVNKAGNILLPSGATIGNAVTSLALGGGNFYPQGTGGAVSTLGTVVVPFFGIWLGTSNQSAFLTSDSLNTLALRNSTAAQTFNVYGTFTTAITNFERLAIKYNATDVAYQIAAEKGSENGDYRPLDFVTGGSRRMTIGTTGNVGIGTTAPTAKLDILTSGSNDGISITNSNGSTSSRVTLINNTGQTAHFSSYSSGIGFGLGNSAGFGGQNSLVFSSDSNVSAGGTNSIQFRAGGFEANQERMRITAAGNVGIGTTAPSSKLHVVGGNILTDGYVTGQRVFSYLGTSTYAGMDTAGIFTNTGVIGFSANTGINFTNSCDTFLVRDGAAYELAVRNGTNGQKFSVYGTYPGAAWERFTITAPTSGNVLLGTYKGTGGIARGLELQVDGSTRLTFPVSGNPTFATAVTFGSDINGQRDVYCGAGRHFRYPNNSAFTSAGAGIIVFEDLGASNATPRFQLGGTSASFPALKRSTTSLQAVLANDSGFTNIQGKLTTDTAYTGTTVVPTGFITLYDSTGTAYKVPCVAA